MRMRMIGLAILACVLMGLSSTDTVQATAAVPDASLTCSFGASGGYSTFNCTVSDFFAVPGEAVSWRDVERTLQSALNEQCSASRPRGYIVERTDETLSTPYGNPDILIYGTYSCGYWIEGL